MVVNSGCLKHYCSLSFIIRFILIICGEYRIVIHTCKLECFYFKFTADETSYCHIRCSESLPLNMSR